MAWWNRSALTDLVTEILDGTQAQRDAVGFDLEALEAAATVRHARARRDLARRLGHRPPDAPRAPLVQTPPARERDRQVKIAAHTVVSLLVPHAWRRTRSVGERSGK
ncbi:hypothetical protein ADL12_32815 [Streptomyces regalis]|uniref:Uncharacterized protein n=1 Tax=Streptomyces regalis TaxID=68262 RepID=A0A101JG32_9ACTN|nr:hypothetical protein ADL12_32815 [Streptomyces regalis]